MLKSLRIQNLAIIEAVEIDFDEGLNVFSGETGAGKSIIMDAIGLILGVKASPDLIRTGESFASVEAIFDIKEDSSLLSFLDDLSITVEDRELIIRRTIQSAGKSRVFINDIIINLNTLQKIAVQLVDFCAQGSQHILKKKSEQLHFLDSYGNLHPLLKSFQEKYFAWKEASKDLEELKKKYKDKEDRADFLKFQLKYLNELDIKEDKEDDRISEELNIVSNSESLLNFAKEAESLIHGSEVERSSIMDVLGSLVTKAEKLVEKDKSLIPAFELMTTLKSTLEEVSYFLRDYANKIDIDESQIDVLNARLSALSSVKRKYGPQLSDVIRAREKFREELGNCEQSDILIEEQKKKVAKIKEEMDILMKDLSQKRHELAKDFSIEIEQELQQLNMESAKFKVEFKEKEVAKFGMDDINLLIQSNLGAEFNAVEKIASGGEFSRIMLAFHSVLSSRNEIQVYLFDELDSGISGKAAAVVGKKLRKVSQGAQVICVTHLPQVASYADSHFSVEKKVSNIGESLKTLCYVALLKKEEKVDELARMLGGLEGASEPKAKENALAMIEAVSRD